MRLIFAGTPEFAACALDAIARAGHRIVQVLTRADQPAGRGQKLRASPVKLRAQALGIPVEQPRSLRDPDRWAALRALEADVMVVAAYGLLLPPEVLAIPRLGCLNIHASLLPRWRGAAPIQRAIEAGDDATGITIMQMDAGLDTGPMLMSRALSIGPRETAGRLHDRLAGLGAELVVEALDALAAGRLSARPQPEEGVTYAHRIRKEESQIDWQASAALLERRMRAFDPWPGMVSHLLVPPVAAIKFWSAVALDRTHAAQPGEIIDASGRLHIACGDGVLAVRELQRAGGRRLPVADFLKGSALSAGQRFGAA